MLRGLILLGVLALIFEPVFAEDCLQSLDSAGPTQVKQIVANIQGLDPSIAEAVIDLAFTVGLSTVQMFEAGDLKHIRKPDDSLVTSGDLAANSMIVSALNRLTPGIPILSEENDFPTRESIESAESFWIIDPIDGTDNYASKGSDYSVLIALVRRPQPGFIGAPVFGVIGRPATNEVYLGLAGAGSWRLNLSSGQLRIQRVFATTQQEPQLIRATSNRQTEPLIQTWLGPLGARYRFVRPGGNGSKFIGLASGEIDVYFGPPMKWWDIAAGDALYRYAVKDGEPPLPSPLQYLPHDDLHFPFQEKDFILGKRELVPTIPFKRTPRRM